MHTIKLQIQDSIYDHIMFLLKNLNTKELKIIEDNVSKKKGLRIMIDFSHKSVLEP